MAPAVAILLVGALVPGLRPLVAVVALGGWAGLAAGRRPEASAWAAVVPLAAVLTWPWVLGVDAPLGDPACRNPLSVIALHRVVVAAAGLGIVALLARVHGGTLRELGLGRPGRREAGGAIAGMAALAVGGLWLGPAVARPFFGQLAFPVPVGALLPAVAFGVANGLLEEVLYRGALQAWLARTMPLALAIGVQALVFGIVHVGPEVVSLVPLHVALLTMVGAAGGVARRRFGSLWIPVGVHVGADVALYVGLACRATG